MSNSTSATASTSPPSTRRSRRGRRRRRQRPLQRRPDRRRRRGRLIGGIGLDTVSYGLRRRPASTCRRRPGRRATAGPATTTRILSDVESVIGSSFDDVLTGSQRTLQLLGLGRQRRDHRRLRRGDRSSAGEGSDRIDARDGAADSVDCGGQPFDSTWSTSVRGSITAAPRPPIDRLSCRRGVPRTFESARASSTAGAQPAPPSLHGRPVNVRPCSSPSSGRSWWKGARRAGPRSAHCSPGCSSRPGRRSPPRR